MALGAISKWALRRVTLAPGSRLCLAAVAGLVPVSAIFAPGSGQGAGPELAWAWSGPVALMGGMMALEAMRPVAGFLEGVPALSRVLATGGFAILMGILLQALLIGGAALTVGVGEHPDALAARSLLLSIQAGALCAAVLALRMPAMPGILAYLLLAWVLPALMPTRIHCGIGELSAITPGDGWGVLPGALPPAVALVIAAWLLSGGLRHRGAHGQ